MQKDTGYKCKLDECIDDILNREKDMAPERKLTFGQRVATVVCKFLGEWPYFYILIIGTLIYMYIGQTTKIDPYPFIFFTLLLSEFALIQNLFLQMSSNLIMGQLIWTIDQIFENSKRHDISMMLLHEKSDILNKKIECILEYLKEENKN